MRNLPAQGKPRPQSQCARFPAVSLNRLVKPRPTPDDAIARNKLSLSHQALGRRQGFIMENHDISPAPPPMVGPQRIVVVNSKGGSGKTTLATNLASALTVKGMPAALMDYDKQGSSAQWIKKRPDHCAKLPCIEAYRPTPPKMTRSWFLRVPAQTRYVVTDTPSGLEDQQLRQFVGRADVVLIPVMPSPTDIHAVTRFIERLLVAGRARHGQTRIAIVANRVKLNAEIYKSLRRFLDTLGLPIVAQLRDSHQYLQAALLGMGVSELPVDHDHCDAEEWARLCTWLTSKTTRDDLRTAPVAALSAPPAPVNPIAA